MARRPSDAFSQHSVGSDAPSGRPRRMSMEEDMFYRELMTSRPAKPPSYDSAVKAAVAAQRRAQAASGQGIARHITEDVLPQYSCAVHMEGVFMRKMEIEETTKRAEYRDWRMVYVELRGTALNVYSVKKERGWWSSSKHDGPDILPDNPPWVKKSTLEKSYSLLHADAGIAADYRNEGKTGVTKTRTAMRGGGDEPADLDYGGDEDGAAGYGPRTDHPIVGRLSTTSYPNESIDPETGKWKPQHGWSTTHDLLYARLCYSVLLFKSPRKSNYVIARGKRWYVDWGTGRMVRALPPAYGELDVMGPWQVIMPENRLI
ncbi:hypothetical protein CHGG_03189 [Chaetomium globosum CBS 148.51]|uniref:Uncharacterized protein n=1 Tax=Chaetomium globosum (strain ATCC 6205 / CBS 148.51 / DSM 1962 / NBRC 6347 / NRRL 1970) TaxID=306901 RepID=Q2H9B5_CHAGB|nr:uncharacterized protein CHGG_03189 [Chaetomium globosum CBS 148.51]EAQ91254.1 hypothetical protein CHGG_03189 [Chaetomium globosum CBS 148.51]